MQLFLISVAGGMGSVARYLIGLWIFHKYSRCQIPPSILIVNLLGAFGLGLFYGMYFAVIPVHPYKNFVFLVVGVGFFGAFTTFSAFSMEVIELLRKKEYKKAALYISITIVGSVIILYFGFVTGRCFSLNF